VARTAPVSKSGEAIDKGEFFIQDEVPTGAVNGTNKTFTLAYNPNPDASMEVFINGQKITLTDDYSLSTDTVTMDYAYPTGTIITINYHRLPV